jgi:hypothetical protein
MNYGFLVGKLEALVTLPKSQREATKIANELIEMWATFEKKYNELKKAKNTT